MVPISLHLDKDEVLERGVSLTHEHILTVIVTELMRRRGSGVIRILDIGCGNGLLIKYLHKNLPKKFPGIEFEIYGLDVYDHGVQAHDFFPHTISTLHKDCPGPDWAGRIRLIASKESWPYQDEYLNIVVTNQVLEHVMDHTIFFSELYRTLKYGGFSVNLFPLKHYIYEGHLRLPLVHRFVDFDFRHSYIRVMSWFGLGKYPVHRQKYGMNLYEYSEKHSDYIGFMTNYLSRKEIMSHAKKAQLRGSFRYTQEFYFRKFRNILKLSPHYVYKMDRNFISDWLWVNVLKYISSVTVFLEKLQTYVVPGS